VRGFWFGEMMLENTLRWEGMGKWRAFGELGDCLITNFSHGTYINATRIALVSVSLESDRRGSTQ